MMHRKVQSTVSSIFCRGARESFQLHKPVLTVARQQEGSGADEATLSQLRRMRFGVSATQPPSEDSLRVRAPWVAATLERGKYVGAILASDRLVASSARRRRCFARSTLAFEGVGPFGDSWPQQVSFSDDSDDSNHLPSSPDRLMCERECASSKSLRSFRVRTYDDDLTSVPSQDWFAVATTHSTLFLALQPSIAPSSIPRPFIHTPRRQPLFALPLIPFGSFSVIQSSASQPSIPRPFIYASWRQSFFLPPLACVRFPLIQSSASLSIEPRPSIQEPCRQSSPSPSSPFVRVLSIQTSASHSIVASIPFPSIHTPCRQSSFFPSRPFVCILGSHSSASRSIVPRPFIQEPCWQASLNAPIYRSSTHPHPNGRPSVDVFGKIFFLPRKKKPPDDLHASGLVTIQCCVGRAACC